MLVVRPGQSYPLQEAGSLFPPSPTRYKKRRPLFPTPVVVPCVECRFPSMSNLISHPLQETETLVHIPFVVPCFECRCLSSVRLVPPVTRNGDPVSTQSHPLQKAETPLSHPGRGTMC